MRLDFSGLMAPVFTPFSDDGSLDLDIIPAYADFLSENGIRGVLVNGTSGEGMSLSVSERKLTAETWLQNAGTIHVQVQVGGTNYPDVVQLASHAEQKGAHSLLCLPELFNKPASAEELVEYLKLVAAAAPKTPLLYYHNPAYTGVHLNVPALMALAGAAVPTFAGIKYTDTNLEMGLQCVALQDGAHAVFLGCDTVLAGAFLLGFGSAIATSVNVFPRLCGRIRDAVQCGDSVREAAAAQRALNEAIQAVTKNGKWVPAMKAAMGLVTGLHMGPVRFPLQPHPVSQSDVAEALRKLGLL